LENGAQHGHSIWVGRQSYFWRTVKAGANAIYL